MLNASRRLAVAMAMVVTFVLAASLNFAAIVNAAALDGAEALEKKSVPLDNVSPWPLLRGDDNCPPTTDWRGAEANMAILCCAIK